MPVKYPTDHKQSHTMELHIAQACVERHIMRRNKSPATWKICALALCQV